MKSTLLIVTASVALLGLLILQLGVLDRPAFEYSKTLVPGREQELFAIVATSTNRNIAQDVEKIMTETKRCLDELETGPSRMQAAAKLYNSPEGAEHLAVGLYFDDPMAYEHPRWAIGWMVDTDDSWREAKHMGKQVKECSTLDEDKHSIHAVRIGHDHVLKARIPWRNFFTPMIQPMFQWNRGYDTYEKKGYTSNHGRHPSPPGGSDKSEKTDMCDGSIALEVYVTGPKDSYAYIDYVVLMGDTAQTWNDCFPTAEQEEKQHVMEAIIEGENSEYSAME